MKTYTAKRVSRSGSTPVYEYREYRVVNSSGTRWGRGWIYEIEGVTKFAHTLKTAKYFIDLWIEEGRA